MPSMSVSTSVRSRGTANASSSEQTPKKSLTSTLRRRYASPEPWMDHGHLRNLLQGIRRGARERVRITPPARVAALTLLAAATLAAGLFGCGESSSESIGPGSSGQSGTLIRTVEGPVQGKIAGATRAFLGIPYVAPPIGDLRWKPPRPIEHWSAPRDATAFGPGCPQGAVILPPGAAPEFPQDESCLYLNVWTPEPPPHQTAPVMVWIPGRGFF